jgi:ankyrin repeat protein
LEQGANVNGTVESNAGYQETTLHICACNHNDSFIEHLIQKGADIHRLDEVGDSPLAKAIRYNKVQAAKTLLEYGAKFQANYTYALTYLIPHCRHMVALLVEWGLDVHSFDDRDYRNPPWLNDAILLENVEAVECLLELGANPSNESYDNYNAFRINAKMHSMFGKHIDAVDEYNMLRRLKILCLV